MTLPKAYLLILGAFIWLVLCGVLFSIVNPPTTSTLADVLGWSMLLGFSLIFLAGTSVWAGAKGYPPLLGFILGWIGPLGLLVLVFLTDKTRSSNTAD